MKTRLAISTTAVLFAFCGCTVPQGNSLPVPKVESLSTFLSREAGRFKRDRAENARGQSPHHGQTTVIPATNGNLATIWRPLHDEHAYASSYHSTSGFPGYNRSLNSLSGDCPPGADCPPGDCPPYGHGLAHGFGGAYGHGCPGCGSGQGCPHHYHSYDYRRPTDLVYPPANAPAGAVVYPYYTHKGPSDFFRDDRCNCADPRY